MPRGKGIYDNEDTEEPKGGRPGPNDDSGDGWHGDTGEHT